MDVPELGDLCEDKLTGFIGIVTGVTDWLMACQHISLKPQELGKDCKPQASVPFDIYRIEIKKKKVIIPAPAPRTNSIERGDLVECMVTGYRGIVTGTTQWISGCANIHVQPQAIFEGKPVESQSFDEPMLRLVEKGVYKIPEFLKEPKKETTPEAQPARRTGGPSDIPKLSR